MNYAIPKGTYDILPGHLLRDDPWKASEKWQYLEKVIRNLCRDYGYLEIRTPIFERTDLFVRGVGDATDVVSKEMYNFQDKGKRQMTLRPEGTAPVMRSIAEKHLDQIDSHVKLFYIGPYFRYDRPQAGRYRQFHQFGIEALGESSSELDLEVIDLLYTLYQRLGLKNLKVLLNTVGNASSREKYKTALKTYLTPHFDQLSEDSKTRFTQNPLRILDSKNAKDQEILSNAPSVHDFLDEESKEHFENVTRYLQKQKIPYEITPKLVRGLDYYNKTVFEITSDVLGAQNTIGGGGRFDGLLKNLGGTDLPAIGFATGMERILQTMIGQDCPFPKPNAPFVFIIPLGESPKELCVDLTYNLRHMGIPTHLYLRGKKINKALSQAEASRATFALIIGEDELKNGMAQLKEMQTRNTTTFSLSTLSQEIEKLWSKR